MTRRVGSFSALRRRDFRLCRAARIVSIIASGIPGGGSQTYGGLMSALGPGFAAGSLLLARRASTGVPIILAWTRAIAIAQAVLSCVSATIPLLLATFGYGISAGRFTVTAMSTSQLTAADEIRGRVMALYSICFLGGSLIGGPGFGWLASRIGISVTLRVAAGLCALSAMIVGLVGQKLSFFDRAPRCNAQCAGHRPPLKAAPEKHRPRA